MKKVISIIIVTILGLLILGGGVLIYSMTDSGSKHPIFGAARYRDPDRADNAKYIQTSLESYYARSRKYPIGYAPNLSDIKTLLGGLVLSTELKPDPLGEENRFCYYSSSGETYTLKVRYENKKGSTEGTKKRVIKRWKPDCSDADAYDSSSY